MGTAGLGGMGGPYRLDGGNDVFQVAQWEKDGVPEDVSINTYYAIQIPEVLFQQQ